jgi:uncharacterized membrane protein YkvA (DUF1232 family)
MGVVHRIWEITMWKAVLLFKCFRSELLLVWAMLRDPRTPALAKLTAIAAVLYVVSPVDLVPDLIPILGWFDDGIVAIILLKLATKFLPPELYASLKTKVNGKPEDDRVVDMPK